MKNLIKVLIGLHLLAIGMCQFVSNHKDAIELISDEVRNEIDSLVGVYGAMGGNTTLISKSPLGSGTIAFVYPGELEDSTKVAIKFINDSSVYFGRELNCFNKMGATKNKECASYGIPFIYHTGELLNFKTMTMTLLDIDLKSLHKKIGSFSKDTILILFRDLVKTLKYMHSKGIINEDIKPENIMTRGANVFLCDFNQCDERALRNRPNRGNPFYMSIAVHMGQSPAEYDDMESLFYTMLVLADVDLPWRNLILRREIMEYKQRIGGEYLCQQVNDPQLIEPYTKFYVEVMQSAREKRLPKYDYLYSVFDNALYNGRNRSERIVFEWLTMEEKLAAMAESVQSIESIVFPGTNIEPCNLKINT